MLSMSCDESIWFQNTFPPEPMKVGEAFEVEVMYSPSSAVKFFVSSFYEWLTLAVEEAIQSMIFFCWDSLQFSISLLTSDLSREFWIMFLNPESSSRSSRTHSRDTPLRIGVPTLLSRVVGLVLYACCRSEGSYDCVIECRCSWCCKCWDKEQR